MWSVTAAQPHHVSSWLEVVREVEPLFGPMPDFERPLARNIERGSALCVCDTNARVLGGVLVGDAPPNIGWLAVRGAARRQGVGRTLLTHALAYLPANAHVYVDTFGADNIDGMPARRLYEAFGFVAGEELAAGPEGGTRQRFWLRRS
jgi:GNAT superfamily N-acetyltransferase